MKAATVLIVVGVLVALTMQYSEEEAFLRKLVNKDYGRTIIQTIQLELGQDNAVNRIVGMLQAMLEQLLCDVKKADTDIQQREQQVQQQIKEIDSQVERSRTSKADYEQQVPLQAEEIKDKLSQMQEKSDELKRNKEKISKFQQTREAEHTEYNRRRDEMTAIINGLKEAKGIIAQLQGGSFIQMKDEILAQIHQHNKRFDDLFAGKHGMKTLGSLLIELSLDKSIHADQGTVSVILEIIDDLVESVYQVQKTEMYDDDNKTRFYFQDLQRLQIENNRMEQINVHDAAVIEILNAKYVNLQSNVANAQSIIENKVLERSDWKKTVDEERNSYSLLADQRNDQIATIQKLISLFNDNFSDRVCAILADIKT